MIKTQSQTTFKDFQLISRLGEGSYSNVYKVKRLSDSKIYAFKRVKMDLLNEKEKENALNEVRILASITDPFIIGYNEAFFDENTNSLCIVMEYADSGDLQKMIKSSIDSCKHIPEQEIWQCLVHMSKGLKTLHEMHILHRDLKCANVFISADNIYKLGDLNVSKVAAKGLVYTQTGTPYYASPEVWRDEAYDMKSDIWSLGCVLYEMAALKPPFRANDMQGLYKKVQKGVFERIPRIYSDDLFNVICECLKVHPTLRPNSTQLIHNHIVLRHAKNLEGLGLSPESSSKAKLLGTIELPKNLKFLKERLPRANYDKDKLNNSFEKEKTSSDVKKNIVLRGESAGSKRVEKNKYTSKETIFQTETQLKLENLNKQIESQEKVTKKDEIKVELKKNVIIRKNSDLILEKKPKSRPSSRNLSHNDKKINILHSPLPEINMKKNHSRVLKSPTLDKNYEIKPLISPRELPLENIKQINEILVSIKSPVMPSPKLNITQNEKILNEICLKQNSKDMIKKRPHRPYSHIIKKTDAIVSLQEKVVPQIKRNSRLLNRDLNSKNTRPFSGVDKVGENVFNNNNKEIIARKKKDISLNNLHSNQNNKIVENKKIMEDALDQLKNEIQGKQKRNINIPEIGVVMKNKIVKGEQKPIRVSSGRINKGDIDIIRKNSNNSNKEEYNVNVFKNKLNLQEKPITAPNVSRGQYKISMKEQQEKNGNKNYRAVLGQQIVSNNHYKIYLKDKNNFP